MLDHRTTIEQFLAATAARQPTPGGGAVAALAGALAAALAEMVLNYSVGKGDLAAFEPELKTALAEMSRARQMLIEFMAEDQAAYEALTAAKKLPPADPKRQEAIKIALHVSLNVPRLVAYTALAILALCDRIVSKVNKYLLSDLAIAADLATATVRCAIYNVKVNISEIPDPHERARLEDSNQKTLIRALELIQKISPEIWNRLGTDG
ncbi:MAG TPA: cyclodeaminase/cyclohydrolase family protein [Tepidisphaeraceae bacterium]|nr:cyclodeaminase/cyclohydrolase family protein [Tepidisphaeraceae bacterium]